MGILCLVPSGRPRGLCFATFMETGRFLVGCFVGAGVCPRMMNGIYRANIQCLPDETFLTTIQGRPAQCNHLRSDNEVPGQSIELISVETGRGSMA